MTRSTVLYVCHNHPSVRPGGAENYAHELFSALHGSDRYRGVFLAKGGPPVGYAGRHHEGTLIAPVGARPDEYFLYTDGYEYDWLNGTITDKDFYTHHVAAFLRAIRPDVVHIQHTSFIGYDFLRVVRAVLPHAAIVYTLHEYMPICHRDGQMLRTRGDQLCEEASPRRCHECFPDITPQQFFLRSKFIKANFELVDRFVSPSRFLLERYVDWGIPREKVVFEENGRTLAAPRPSPERDHRDRFGFFGQVSEYKGLDLLLEAFRILGRRQPTGRTTMASLFGESDGATGRARPHLFVHGANLDLQSSDYQRRIKALSDATADDVTSVGRYEPRQLPALMAGIDWVVIPSIWWENSPLVIQEAFHHGRPIICSDIGGMAEKVVDGVDGLHFRARDAHDLADVIQRAATEPELWEQMQRNRPVVHPVSAHVDRLSDLYDEILSERSHAGLSHVG